MKKLFFLIPVVFFLSFQSQAQVFIEPGADISQFDWSAFSDTDNIQKYINTREGYFDLLGFGDFTATVVHIDKSDLIKLQQELYKESTQERLTANEIIQVQNAIKFHFDRIKEKEIQIMASAGFIPIESGLSIDIMTFPNPSSKEYKGAWNFYKKEYDIIFDFVEKTDKDFYQALGQDDEAYAEFILPYMNDYIAKGQVMADTYTNVLEEAYKNPEAYFKGGYVSSLNWMSLRSYDIYKCFLKNFKNPVGENQQALMNSITGWYADQSLKGAKALMGEYELLNTTPSVSGLPTSIVSNLLDYAHKDTPEKVREELEVFFRRALTDERLEVGSFRKNSVYLDALIGLKYLNALNPEEEEAFKRAEELGGVKFSPKNPGVYWSSPTTPLQ